MKRFLYIFLFLSVILPVQVVFSQSPQDQTFEILKNLDIYTDVIKELNAEYVDDIQPGELSKAAIDAMLLSLDPYTNFIPETEVEDYKFITTGQYGGIGALIHQQDDYVIISEPYEGSPAQKSGLLAGDKIVEVNGQSAVGKSYDEVSAILKGQAGTEVQIKVKREGRDLLIEKNITRENIKIDNIPYYGIVGGDVAYIKLTGFTQNAGKEVKQAFLKLKEKQAVQGVIIDLRNNGGGLLNEAVDLSNIFMERGQEIVTTKGKVKERNRVHMTMYPPVDLKIPLIVLIDNQSASASEIFAGAMQDLDRGVVIGQRTFGKGLVQNVVPLSYNAQLKITVAKYYIPSGRCIQAIDYSHKDNNGYFTKIPDSLIREFTTRKGRKVYDGGGISPDISVKPRKFSQIAMTLFGNFLIFDYATKYRQVHPEIAPVSGFEISDSTYTDFLNFIADKNYTYTTRSEQALERLKQEAERENYLDAIEEEYALLKEHMILDKEADIKKYEDQIRELLRMEIISRYYYQRGKVESSLANDPELARAIEILHNPDIYYAILDGTLIDPGNPGVVDPVEPKTK
ncbi:MAG: PDZ domain-containing protein [Bacteroidales bacterium]|nr:PDZ domain-containing protein [Bacteroidales bacterium]